MKVADIYRNVKIVVINGFAEATVDVTGSTVDAAIDYLSRWAIGSSRYVNVNIVCDQRGEILAAYFGVDGECNYNIGAVLDSSGEYSFHS